MKRREFLAASAGCACLLFTKSGRAETASTGPVKVGALASFTKEGLDDRFLKHGFFLVRGKDRVYALSAFCTHRTDVKLEAKTGSEKIICPRHKAQFALDGTVTRPPAKRSLSRLAITVDAKGELTVDTSITIAPDKADEANAFVKVS